MINLPCFFAAYSTLGAQFSNSKQSVMDQRKKTRAEKQKRGGSSSSKKPKSKSSKGEKKKSKSHSNSKRGKRRRSRSDSDSNSNSDSDSDRDRDRHHHRHRDRNRADDTHSEEVRALRAQLLQAQQGSKGPEDKIDVLEGDTDDSASSGAERVAKVARGLANSQKKAEKAKKVEKLEAADANNARAEVKRSVIKDEHTIARTKLLLEINAYQPPTRKMLMDNLSGASIVIQLPTEVEALSALGLSSVGYFAVVFFKLTLGVKMGEGDEEAFAAAAKLRWGFPAQGYVPLEPELTIAKGAPTAAHKDSWSKTPNVLLDADGERDEWSGMWPPLVFTHLVDDERQLVFPDKSGAVLRLSLPLCLASLFASHL
jgi:hypothetical protein